VGHRVMVYKTPIKNQTGFTFVKKEAGGFTIVELIISISVIMILISGVSLIIRPGELKARARDNRRLSDLNTFESGVNQFRLENDRYPTPEELSLYMVKVPVDPINTGMYQYSYSFSGTSYELNARLEYFTAYAADDGGTDPDIYEVGNDLTIF